LCLFRGATFLFFDGQETGEQPDNNRGRKMSEDINRGRLIVPSMAGLYEALAPYGYAFIRFIAGVMLIPHGYPKLFQGAAAGTANAVTKIGLEPALAWAYAAGCVEVFGGILLALGLLTRVAAAAAAVEFAVIVLLLKWPNGFFAAKGGMEFELMWGLLCLVFFIKGGGRYSLDRLVGKEF
jgi:putative oxidoreductase